MHCARAVSQSLCFDKDREEWFSLGENHERAYRFGLHQLRNCASRIFSISILRICFTVSAQTGAPSGERRTYGGGMVNTPPSAPDHNYAPNFTPLQISWRSMTENLRPD